MMKDYAQRAKRTEKGDGFSVTLLCFAAILAAIAVHALTERYIAFQDRLVAFAPADARIYVHANGTAAASKLMALAAPYVAVEPSEAAVFSRPGATANATEGDGDAWTTLLAWQTPFGPSEREAALLARAGAVSLGDGRYSLDGGTADSARLTDDPSVSRALASARDRAAIQAYVADPALLPGLPRPADEAAPPGSRVAWLLLRDGYFSLTVMPVDVAAGRGRRLHDARFAPAMELPAGAPSADIVLREQTLSVDLLAILVDRIASGDRTAATGPAADKLRDALTGPVVASLRRDAAQKRVDFAFHFPTLPRTKLESEMSDFLASAWPTRHTTVLPDGDVSVEFRIDPDRYRFSTVSTNPPIYPEIAAVEAGPAASPLYAADDGRSGSLLASEQALLIEARETALSGRGHETCLSDGRGSMTLHRPGNLFADEPHLLGLFGALTTSTVTVTDLGDNILRICGYSKLIVDK